MSRMFNKNRPLTPAPVAVFTDAPAGIVATKATGPAPEVVFTDAEQAVALPVRAVGPIPAVVFLDPFRSQPTVASYDDEATDTFDRSGSPKRSRERKRQRRHRGH